MFLGRGVSQKRREVLFFLARFDSKADHPHHVATLALDIFCQTKKLHQLHSRMAIYLELGSLLHDIGLTVDASGHHKHSYKLIQQQHFLYLNESEKQLVAAIARYHRKAFPQNHHRAIALLTPEHRLPAVKLAAILRLADGFDRAHDQRISKLKISCEPNNVEIKIVGHGGCMVDHPAIYLKSDLFRVIFQTEVAILP